MKTKKVHSGQLRSAGRVYVRTAEVVGMTEQPMNRRRQGEVLKDGTPGKKGSRGEERA